jgi:glycerophosphoryl diester phosphodiesterase
VNSTAPGGPAADWRWPRVLAHRGGGTLAPENTLAALREGVARGFRGVEFDAMAPHDDDPVLMHDATLGRTANGRGAVAAHTAAELARLDAGGWHSARFAGEPVPRLAEALALCRAHALWPNVEIKPAPGHEARTGTLVAQTVALAYAAELTAGDAAALPLLSSFSEAAVTAARVVAPRLPRALLVDRVPDDWAERVAAHAAVSLNVNHRHLTAAQARAIKAAGCALFCYTVNDPARARELLAWGVDAFCTDRLDLIGPDFA